MRYLDENEKHGKPKRGRAINKVST